VPTDQSHILFGAFSFMTIGIWGLADIMVNPLDSRKSSRQISMSIAGLRAIAATRAAYFSICKWLRFYTISVTLVGADL
jgi:hypothetical protein